VSSDLVHLIREPAGEPDGALILNHGRGSDEHDLFPLLDELDPQRRLLGITTGAPLEHGASTAARVGFASLRLPDIPPGGRHWYRVPRVGYPDPETFAYSYGLLTGFLDDLLTERGIGWDRTAIGGFSMGAVMSYSVALGPDRPVPAALLAFSGFIPTVEGWQPELAGRESLGILIHHGRNDPVISVEFARGAKQLLESGGLSVGYLESDAGHWLPPEVLPPATALVDATIPSQASKPANPPE
jgi:phospholipase/carboxylesterase